MSRVIKKAPRDQTRKEKLINLKAARAAKKRKAKGKTPRKSAKSTSTRKRKPTKKTPVRRTMKRRRTGGDLLTGGTKDVNPQFMSGSLKQTAINTDIDIAIQNPVAKGIFALGGKATVMEILKVFIDVPISEPFGSAAPTVQTMEIYLSTKKVLPITPAFNIAEPSVFAWGRKVILHAFTAAGSVLWGYNPVQMTDLTDNVGHGLLIASDKIWFTVTSTAMDVVMEAASFKIFYRFKNVSVQEYVGIAQSQQ